MDSNINQYGFLRATINHNGRDNFHQTACCALNAQYLQNLKIVSLTDLNVSFLCDLARICSFDIKITTTEARKGHWLTVPL